MSDPLHETRQRLQGDLMHDNFVPEYSSLATAEPSTIVLMGTWLLFGPTVLFAPLVLYTMMGFADGSRPIQALLILVMAAVCGLSAAILFKVTRRYIRSRGARRPVD